MGRRTQQKEIANALAVLRQQLNALYKRREDLLRRGDEEDDTVWKYMRGEIESDRQSASFSPCLFLSFCLSRSSVTLSRD